MPLAFKLIFAEAAHIEWALRIAIQESKTGSNETLVIALVTALLTLSAIVLKDLLFKILAERRAEKKIELAVYERYSGPGRVCKSFASQVTRDVLPSTARYF